ncbi:hypothetical protein M0802_006801 [Mischocyttarus mexicanus]|nr:hypothetical protein M0802_006801 [Mischocyttarus mexicanus]
MANFRYSLIKFVFGCNLIFLVYSNPVNISLHSVNKSLIETALHSLNENSPTHHTYTGGQLISAEKLDELSHVIYRLTFNLSPICKETGEFCPTEACTINIKQDEYGDIQVQRDSIQCTYLYPQSSQNSEVPDQKEETNYENQESMDNLNKQIIQNGSNTPDKEIKSIGDQNDPQIISVKTSNSNYCPGCPYDLNTHLPGFIAFKREIEKQMDEILSNNFKHMVVEIVRATRSVPPSSNVIKFQLLVKVGESSCLKNLLTSISDCTLQSNVPIKTCLVTFEEQPLKHDTRQITKNNCTAISTVDFNKAKNLLNESYIIAKNDAYEGLKSIIADDLTYTSTYNTQNEKSPVTEHSFVKVLINKTKDEEKPENFTDKIKEFQEFLEDFDIPIKKHVNSDSKKSTINELKMVSEEISLNNNDDQNNIDSNLSSDNTKRSYSSDVYDVSSRKKRQLVGAPSNTNVNDPEIIEYANLGLKKFSQNLESTNEPIIVEIIEATSQVVSGMLYKIKAKLGISDCTKGTKNNCKLQEGSDLTECLFTIWSQPWVDKGSPNVKVDCNNAGRSKRHLEGAKRQIPGAPSNTNVNDPEIIEYANLGLKKFSQNLESTNEPIIVEILEATSQVVSGMLYKIKAKLGISDCTKGTKNNCKLQEGSDLTECLFTIWSQPWVDEGSPSVQVDCNDAARTKRHLKGAGYNQKMLAQAESIKHERKFEEFIINFNKNYLSEDEKMHRFKIFKENLKEIERFRRYELGTAEYGVTMFADLTYEEFKKQYLGLRPDLQLENHIPMQQAKIPDIELPVEYDWRHYDAVTPVKDQGQCGSCWAFSVTGNVEGQYAIKHGKLLSLSEQELLDCDKLDDACDGGLPDNAYRAIESLGGLELETDYPYKARNEKCNFNEKKN